MQLTVLGSGSALPTHRRASSGYLLEWSGGALLLDASSGTYTRALKAGLDPHRLEAVVLSHFHPDHTADLPGLLWARRQMDDLDSALRIEADGRTLAYSGDSGDCEGLRAACRGVDLALLECSVHEPEEGHMTEWDCAAVIEAARPGRSLLVHLGPDVDPGLPVAEDGQVVTV